MTLSSLTWPTKPCSFWETRASPCTDVQTVAHLCFDEAGLGWAESWQTRDKMSKVRRQLVKRREVREISESCWKGPSESCQHSSGTFAGIASTTGCVSLQENHGQDGHLHPAQLQGCSDRRCHRSEQGPTVVLQVFDRQRHTHKHVNTHTTDTTDTTDTRHTHTHQKITTHTHIHLPALPLGDLVAACAKVLGWRASPIVFRAVVLFSYMISQQNLAAVAIAGCLVLLSVSQAFCRRETVYQM